LGAGFFVLHGILTAVKRVEFVSDRVLYVVLRGRWCNGIVLNVHAPSEGKSYDSKDSFYDELQKVFHHFLKYRAIILLEDFNDKVGRENIFKPRIGSENLHQDSDTGDRIVNFATSKNSVVKSRYSHTETFISTLGPLLMGRPTTRLIAN
jgi:hypothetical protein